MQFLLYGANGYTGELIARLAKSYDIYPIIAGRNGLKIEALAEELGCPFRIFSFEDSQRMDEALREVPVVLHAGGPFIHTARPMLEACLRTGTHYLDITGELAVFEMAARLNDSALNAGIMLMPGVGFDVVPSDCLALYLKNRQPNATHLKLAFASVGGGISHGTALTMVENLGEPGAVRKDGKIVQVPLGHKTLHFPAGERRLFAMTIPWGDVSTAWYSTGIPNIEVYTAVSPSTYRQVLLSRRLGWLLRSEFIKNIARRRVHQRPSGPSAHQRAHAKSYLWGEVSNAEAETKQATLVTPEGYALTAQTSLLVLKKVLSGIYRTGFQTPARAYGEDLILEVEGVERTDLDATP